MPFFRFASQCFTLATLLAICVSPIRASVAYIVNCCNNPSTVGVFDTTGNRQKAQWSVGNGAADAAFSPDGSIAYVSNSVSQSVTVVKVSTGAILATIPAGYGVSQMVVTPDGSTLIAESYDYAYESHLVMIDTITNLVTQAVGFASALGPMAISPDGKTLYVTSLFSAKPGLLVLDAAFLTEKTTIPITTAVSVAVTPNGQYAYVPNFGNSGPYDPNVAVVDTSSNTVVTNIPIGTTELNPALIRISPDGSQAWVAEFQLYTNVSPVINVIQTSTNQVVGSITLLGRASPGTMVFSPDGTRAYVAAAGASVDVVDVAAMKAVAAMPTLGSVGGLAVSPDGKTLLVPNSGSSQVAAISEAGGHALAKIPVGAMDYGNQEFLEYGGAAVSRDGTRAYVTNYTSGNVSVIDTASKTVVTSVEAGADPVGVVVSADGHKAYVANSFSNSVTIVDTGTFVTKQIPMPEYSYPTSIAISPDGTRVYVAGDNVVPDFGNAACYVFVIDTSSEQVVNSIRVPYPMALAVSPDGTKIYVVGESAYLYTISTATNTITSSLLLENNGATQPATAGIAVTPDGTRVFADDGGDNNIFEVDVTQNKVVLTIQAGSVPGVLAVTPDGRELWAGDYEATWASVIDVASGTVAKRIDLGSQSYGIAFGPQ
jgi:YVTN family beta-propeller protein